MGKVPENFFGSQRALGKCSRRGVVESSGKCDFEESSEISLRLEVYSWRAVFRSTLPTSLNLIKLSECFWIALWRRKWRIVSRFYQTDLLFSLHHSPPKTFLNDFAVAAKRNVLSQSAFVGIYCRFCNVNFYSHQSLSLFFFCRSSLIGDTVESLRGR